MLIRNWIPLTLSWQLDCSCCHLVTWTSCTFFFSAFSFIFTFFAFPRENITQTAVFVGNLPLKHHFSNDNCILSFFKIFAEVSDLQMLNLVLHFQTTWLWISKLKTRSIAGWNVTWRRLASLTTMVPPWPEYMASLVNWTTSMHHPTQMIYNLETGSCIKQLR